MIKTIIIIDDHKIMRDGLRALLEKEKNLQVIGEAGDGRTGIKLAQELSPDVVIMDVSMPDMNGIEATRQIKTNDPTIKVIALSMYSDRQFIAGMIIAGASAYLVKDCAFEELARAVFTVTSGEMYISPSITHTLVKDYSQQLSKCDTSAFSILTAREREIVQLIAEGKNLNEIARELYISVKTAETHRRNIMCKLDVHSVAELTKYAIREGITFV